MFLAREFQIQQRHNRTKHRYKMAQSTDIALAMLNKDQANNDKLNDASPNRITKQKSVHVAQRSPINDSSQNVEINFRYQREVNFDHLLTGLTAVLYVVMVADQ